MSKNIIFSALLLVLFSCNIPHIKYDDDKNKIEEIFDESNRPGLEYNIADNSFLVKPWNYEKSYNSTRKYPLLIYLHGSDQAMYIKNLCYMGMGYYDWSDSEMNMTSEYKKDMADEFRKTYPCFTFVPQTKTHWNETKLISQIEALKSQYRIDTNRIYIHGFSMGASIIYPLAEAYYDYNGQLFAAIIRLNGGGTKVRDEIINKTSIWLMCGEQDGYLSQIRKAYENIKNHTSNASARESEVSDYTISFAVSHATTHEYKANTSTLTKKGIVIARKTEFPAKGHIIITTPFGIPSIGNHSAIEWTFNQSLENR